MPVPDPGTAFCLERVGKSAAGWGTLVVSGAADTVLPAENLWAVWADLEHWPLWSPLHHAVTRVGPDALAAGVSFDQQISLGFPVGTTTQHVTIAVLEPARRAAWAGDANGVRSCHLWSITPQAGGGTRVSNTEAFAGLPVGMLRPLVARRWNRAFQVAVDGLIGRAADGKGPSR